tara:strand:- start:237 stop:497 length:261 start_codon:yes stop_codon:yes gene_type:complete
MKLTKAELRNIIIEEVNQLTGLKEPSPLEEFMLDFEKLWQVLTQSEAWGTVLQNDPEMREEVFHAVLRNIKEDLGLASDHSRAYFE